MSVGGDDDTLASVQLNAATTESPVPGLIAGRYRIVRWLGGGGMGRVYEALDTELDERVALKVLRSGLSDEAIERFRREVKLTRRIQHKNVARMFDLGAHEGEKFLTMELIDGVALSTQVTATPMPWALLRPIAEQICAGLAAAHAAGVVHRDLKPDNVLVENGTGRVVITDFGIARGAEDPGVTQVGAVVGTPRYMSPEQLTGSDVDARADLFSLGVMLFELATGQRPWDGDNAVMIAVSQATQPMRPLDGAAIPPDLVKLLTACLQLDPGLRPATATEVAHAITTGELPAVPTRALRVSRPPPAPAAATSIAVLPPQVAPGDEYLGDVLLEELTDALSTAPGLRVRPAGVVRAAGEQDPRDIGKRLDVDQVAVASLRRRGDGLRIAARLINVTDGFQIWASKLDCTEPELLAATETLGRGIATALSTRAAESTQPTDPRAVDLYLRARAEMRRFWGTHVQAAADLLTQAVQLAPTSPQVVSAYAWSAVQAWVMRQEEQLFTRAHDAVERALTTGHGEAFLAAAQLRFNQGADERAARDLGTAIARVPMSSQAHELAGKILLEVDGTAEARHHYETAIGLDPGRAVIAGVDVARIDALDGKWQECDARIAPLLADPDPAIAQLGLVNQARFATWRGDRELVIGLASRFSQRLGLTATSVFRLMSHVASTGAMDPAMWKAFRDQPHNARQPLRQYLLRFQLIAELSLLIGDYQVSLEALEKCAQAGLFDVTWLDHCPLFMGLAARSGFNAVRRIVAARAARVLAAYRSAATSA